MDDIPNKLSFALAFDNEKRVPTLASNHFVVQITEDGAFLTIGQVDPPLLLGTPEEQLEQAQGVPYLPIKVLGRFNLTREKASELAEIITTNLAAFDDKEEA